MKTFSVKTLALAVLVASGIAAQGLLAESHKKSRCDTCSTKQVSKMLKFGTKLFLPPLFVLLYFSKLKPKLKEVQVLSSDKDLRAGVEKVIDCLLGVWLYDRIKEFARHVDAQLGNSLALIAEEATETN